MVCLIFIKWSIDWQQRMALGSCNYDEYGAFGGCTLSSDDSCYSFSGAVCTADTPLADKCPLNYGGEGDGCQPPNLITTLINIVLKPGTVEEPMYVGRVLHA
jgi:V-type H+-transporting ATPase subunit a